ncbi:MAG: HlyD family efflux transporter periplasmic adaptor subunit, partial [Planctomycetota bacterium]
ALAHTATQLGDEAFTEHDAATICKWLIDSQLAHTEASGTAERLAEAAYESQKKKRAQWLNPIVLRLPLVRPDRMLSWCNERFGGLVSWSAFSVWLFTIIMAAEQLLVHRDEFSRSNNVLAPGNIVWLAITWTALKFIHEFSHGLACRRFGGRVREAGIVMIAFAPIPYVDVTSSWRFPSKWQRIFVAAAGMYSELFIAAIAALVWVRTEPGLVNQQAQNVMLTASFATLLFNANPLMRFDGYYMLSDWLEIPNLYGLGQQYTQFLGRKYIMGVNATLPNWSRRERFIIPIYGVLSFLWRIVVSAGLMIAVATLFKGAGIVLAIAGGIMWVAMPTIKLVKYLAKGNKRERPKIKRFCFVLGTFALALTTFLLLPEPGGVRAPATVVYEPLYVVRAPYSGFVREIRVASGQEVNRDQVLAVLENEELAVEVAELQLERYQSYFRSRQFRGDQDVAAANVENEFRASIEARLAERSSQLGQSELKSEVAGKVVTREMRSLIGTYVREGEALFEIGTETKKELELSIAQQDIESFENETGNPVVVHLKNSRKLRCHLGSVNPRASVELSSEALSAANGGSLAVQPVADESSDRETRWQLIEPRFTGRVELTDEQSESLHTGQTTTVRLHASRGTLGAFLYRSVSDWIENRWRMATAS